MQACQVPGEYLLVEDTTTLSFNTHPATVDLGPVNDQGGRGFLVHNTLALRVAGWDRDQVPTVTVLGLAGQHCWRRPKVALKPKQKAKAGRLGRTRESARWMASLARIFHKRSVLSWCRTFFPEIQLRRDLLPPLLGYETAFAHLVK